jgi:hypothetical protein
VVGEEIKCLGRKKRGEHQGRGRGELKEEGSLRKRIPRILISMGYMW